MSDASIRCAAFSWLAERVAEHDDVLPWYAVEVPVGDLPAGDYRVMVILYDRETVKKVSGVDLATGLPSDIHPVMSFTVDG